MLKMIPSSSLGLECLGLGLGVFHSKVCGDGDGIQISSSADNDDTPQLIVEESDLGIEVVNRDDRSEECTGDLDRGDGCERTSIPQDPLSHLPPSMDRNCFNFPFFTDRKTIKHISKGKSKWMFILRGLSGSGKSSIVRLLKSTYKDSVVCSADDYFLNEDGDYFFDVEKLGNAHGYCQNKAKSSCQNATSVVIIDNTNVKRWEMKFYLETAKLFGYVVILVEPKTEWKFKPDELAIRNKHGVPVEVLRKKVEAFSQIIPMYYGWFLSHKKSDLLKSLSSKVFAHCLDSFPAFRTALLSELGVHRSGRVSPDTAKEILLGYYSDQSRTSSLLHCTSRFCGAGKASGGKKYDSRQDVQSSCGRVFRLTLTGLVLTKKTFGVRVTLDEKCLALFERPEEAEWVSRLSSSSRNGKKETSSFLQSPSSSSSSLLSNSGQRKGVKKNGEKNVVESSKRLKKRLAKEKKRMETDSWLNSKEDCTGDDGNDDEGVSDELVEVHPNSKSSLFDLMNAKISDNEKEHGDKSNDDDGGDDKSNIEENVDSESGLNLGVQFPQLRNSGFARCAHITLKTTNSVSSVETNLDILHACDIEHSANNGVHPADFVPVPKGKALYFGDGMCCVYFDQPIKMDAVFSGYY